LRLFLPAFDSPEVDLRVYRVSPQKQFTCRDAAFFHLTASVQLELLLAWKAMSLDELPMGCSLIGEKSCSKLIYTRKAAEAFSWKAV
jgi:hypothetical protein